MFKGAIGSVVRDLPARTPGRGAGRAVPRRLRRPRRPGDRSRRAHPDCLDPREPARLLRATHGGRSSPPPRRCSSGRGRGPRVSAQPHPISHERSHHADNATEDHTTRKPLDSRSPASDSAPGRSAAGAGSSAGGPRKTTSRSPRFTTPSNRASTGSTPPPPTASATPRRSSDARSKAYLSVHIVFTKASLLEGRAVAWFIASSATRSCARRTPASSGSASTRSTSTRSTGQSPRRISRRAGQRSPS